MNLSDENENDLQLHAQMGMAALIPGFQRAVDLMQAELDKLRTSLAAMQGRSLLLAANPPPAPDGAGRRGRPPKKAAEPVKAAGSVKTPGKGWPDDPEERRQEMQRRMKTAKARKKSAAISASAKDRWNKMSARQRKARLAAMAAGRRQQVSAEAVA